MGRARWVEGGKGREGSWGWWAFQESSTTVEAIRRRKHSDTVLWTVDPGVQEKPGVRQKALA